MDQKEMDRLIKDLMNSSDEYVIYGTGSGAAKVVASLGYFYSKISYFIDSSNEGDFCGNKVKHVKNVNFGNIKGLIIASQYYDEILKEMAKNTSLDSINIYLPYKIEVVKKEAAEIAREENEETEKLNERLKNKCGRYSYGINNKTVESERLLQSVGSYCSINEFASIGTLGNHPLDLVTTTHEFYSPRWGIEEEYKRNLIDRYSPPIVIENDVWVGKYAIILPGVTIHNGAIIAAGAVVTKDVPPYAIVGGVPARIIRYRFEPHIIEALLDIKWWDWDDEKLKENFELFLKPEEFVKVHHKKG